MGGWLSDDSKMRMDEKKAWGNRWNLFWLDVLIWVEMTHSPETGDGHGMNISTWVCLTKVRGCPHLLLFSPQAVRFWTDGGLLVECSAKGKSQGAPFFLFFQSNDTQIALFESVGSSQ